MLNQWIRSGGVALLAAMTAGVLGCAAAGGGGHGGDRGSPAGPPNILLIMVDDLGKEWVPAFGGEGVATPHLDALAAGGMAFDAAYSMPQCTPSRVSLLTGHYPWNSGWVNHWDVPRWGVGYFDWKHPRNATAATRLRELGYATCAAGKWQINDFRLEPEAMRRHGFDDWCMWTGYEADNPPSAERYADPYVHTPRGSRTLRGAFGPDVFADHLIGFMEEHRDRPQLLYFPMVLTHEPLVATPDEPEAQGPLERHLAMVRYADRLVGRLVDAIDRLGLRENTVVIFTTDNGTSGRLTGRRHGRDVRGAKSSLTEAGVCQPLIVNAPGRVPAGVRAAAITDFTDLLPTLVDLAGGDARGLGVDGVSLVPVLEGRAETTGRDWIAALGFGPADLDDAGIRGRVDYAARVFRGPRYKAWVSEDRAVHRLHDLASDPWEATNLLAQAQAGSDPALAEALARFERAVESTPRQDARPLYTPRGGNAWDRTARP